MSHIGKTCLTFAAYTVLLLARLAIPASAQTGPATPFKQCPHIGASQSCGILIVINASGTASVFSDSTVTPYEQQEDTLIGVQNNSTRTITSFPLNGGSIPIFAFEGDGICDPSTGAYGPLPAGCPFGPYGYEGPGVSFSNINGQFQLDNTGQFCGYTNAWQCANGVGGGTYTTGTVNFNPGIPPGGSAYFALEEALTAAQITIPLSTTCPTPTATLSASYSSQLVGTGGNGNYNWKLASGSLGNLALTPAGLISGVPNTPGPLNFSLLIGDSAGDPALPQACTIQVSAPALSIVCNPPGGSLQPGTAYSAQCTAAGGTSAYSWTYTGLPSWLTGPSSGASVTLTGTVPTPPPNLYTVTVTVTDSSTPKQSQTQTITINVAAPSLNLTCSAPGAATAGTAYSGTCTASGGTSPYSWTYTGLPSWLTGGSSGATVTLSGTPPAPPPNSYSFTVTVTDSSAPVAAKQVKSQAITITVSVPTLNITCSAPGSATVGTAYSGTCTASGGTSPYSWTYSGLPSWLTGGASGTSVTLAGTPPVPPPASYSITVTVTDNSAPTKQTKSQTITITVSIPAVQGVTISQNSSGATANQTTLQIQFGAAAAATYTGTLTLTFKPDAGVTNVPSGYVDPAAGFPVSGSSTTSLTQNFTVNQGQTQASTAFALGTVAGTWTVTLTALTGGVPSPAPSFNVAVAPSAPAITAGSVKIVNATSTGFTVQLIGFATTRDVTSGTFTFSPSAGDQLTGTTTVTVPFNGLDQSQWFNTAAGRSAGGTFSMSLAFSYSGDPNALGSVSVTLTNSKSQTSTAVSGTK